MHKARLGPELRCEECRKPIIWDNRRKEWQHARVPALGAERKADV